MTIGNALEHQLDLTVGCEDCSQRTTPDVAALLERYGPDLAVPDLATRGRCSTSGPRRAYVRVSDYKPPVTTDATG